MVVLKVHWLKGHQQDRAQAVLAGEPTALVVASIAVDTPEELLVFRATERRLLLLTVLQLQSLLRKKAPVVDGAAATKSPEAGSSN